MSKIMRVYYDNAGHPYKDYALSTLYPIVGNEFTGANNTTDIHFYCDNMGQATWVANCVLPNGEKVNRLLVSGVDGDGHTYQVLPLDSELTSVKGHLKIGLNGYAGNISIDEEELENNDLVVISGTPTIIATGIIDIAMNYSPIVIPVSQLTPTEYQELLGIIGNKLDVIKGILVVEDIESNSFDPSVYANGQIFYDKTSRLFYIWDEDNGLEEANTLPNKVDKSNSPSILYGTTNTGEQTTYTFNDVADQVEGIILSNYYTKVESDGRYVHQTSEPNVVYATDNNGDDTDQMEWSYDNGGYTFAVRGSNGTLKVGSPISNDDATTKKYVDDGLQNVREVAEGKCRTIVLSYSSTSVGINSFYDVDGNLHSYTEFSDFVDGLQAGNTLFNSNNNSILIPRTSGWLGDHYYFILHSLGNDYIYPTGTYIVVKDYELCSLLHNGDIILIIETDVPDRWFVNGEPSATLHKLETSKVDLSGYATYSGTNVFTGSNTFNTSVNFVSGLTTSGNIIPSVLGISLGSSTLYFADTHTSELYVSTFKDLSGSRELSYGDLYSTLLNGDKYPSTELQWTGFNFVLPTSNTTFTKQTASSSTNPEYCGKIVNGAGTTITLTFTGITTILCNDDNIVITNGTNSTLELPANTTIEFSIVMDKMVAINWSAN